MTIDRTNDRELLTEVKEQIRAEYFKPRVNRAVLGDREVS
jgi:hypothetical protein